MLELKLKLKVEGKGTGKGKGKADAEAEGIPGTTIAFTFGQGICIRWCDDVIETKHLIINYNRKTDETSDRTSERATRPNCRPIFQKNDPVRPRCGPGAETGPAQSSISNKKKSVQKQIPTLRGCLCRRRRRRSSPYKAQSGKRPYRPIERLCEKVQHVAQNFCGFLATPPKTKVFLVFFLFFYFKFYFFCFCDWFHFGFGFGSRTSFLDFHSSLGSLR